ncbi:hypothetical protein KJZ71_03135 [Patescibacteria group bacterium]|uniref:Uncharacterized protein n=1 Tax=candidate division WWE3 bacterium TaxID=2053526 RepID=A0A928TV95_UNCKA|nr:hypothetical protein [candidate division WWE3 bacterium]MCL4732773.1 hypothetical protein [Patescibacteria group bacterium]MDL1952909.1 hypothetical protein [Candidatus Uhrbacteria bacterium UHB]RIL00629.1 MAG: hypothetical protein DCC77_03710 [Candidatus Uhrbacteria bacterium]
MKNHNHNLIQQLSETLDGSWRFRQYGKDAKGCKRCRTLWKRFEEDFSGHEKLLASEIAHHCEASAFN